MRESNKFMIDMNKLKYNILCLKYKSTKAYKLRPMNISDDVKDVILDILNNRFNKKIFDKLDNNEKVIIENFIKVMKFDDLGVDDSTTIKLFKDFEILRGSYLAGNNSKEVKNALKDHILQLIELKKISHIQGMRIFFEMNLV